MQGGEDPGGAGEGGGDAGGGGQDNENLQGSCTRAEGLGLALLPSAVCILPQDKQKADRGVGEQTNLWLWY